MSSNIREPRGNTLEFRIEWSTVTKTSDTLVPLAGVWKQVVIDYELENPDEDDTVATFKEILKAFFAAHSTEDDRHELASVIRYAIKPEGMKVQPFFIV
jgi:hypothetical protein